MIEVVVAHDDPAVARSLCNWALSTYFEERAAARSDPPAADARVLDACEIRAAGGRTGKP